jgi:hypothetical protein
MLSFALSLNVLATAVLLVSLVLLGASTLWQRRRLAT